MHWVRGRKSIMVTWSLEAKILVVSFGLVGLWLGWRLLARTWHHRPIGYRDRDAPLPDFEDSTVVAQRDCWQSLSQDRRPRSFEFSHLPDWRNPRGNLEAALPSDSIAAAVHLVHRQTHARVPIPMNQSRHPNRRTVELARDRQSSRIQFEACQDAEAQLRCLSSALDNSSDAVCISDASGRAIYHNQAFLDLFEYRPEELNHIGGPSELFLDPETARSTLEAIAAGQSWKCDVVLRRRSGAKVLVSLRAKAVEGRNGSLIGAVYLCTNLSERRQAEAAFWETQRFLHKVADTTPSLLYIYDLKRGCNIYINRQSEEFFGAKQPQIQAMGSRFFTQFLQGDDRSITAFERQLSDTGEGEAIERECRIQNRHGEWRWLQHWIVVFKRTEDGKPEQILGTAIDITERKRAEEIHLELQREQELNRLQMRFFSMVSHEFRTPLSTICMSAQILEHCSEEWQTQKKARNLDRIQVSVKYLLRLLNDIMTINRAETGKLEFVPQSIDLEEFCTAIVEEMRLMVGPQHAIELTCRAPGLRIEADEKLLRSILSNLVSNAIKYSPQGGRISLDLDETQGDRGTVAILRISDEGIGLAAEELPHLYEPFHRGRNIGTIAGSGLGLTVVKKGLELHGGTIQVASELDRGTTFAVTLPVRLNSNQSPD